VGWGYATYVVNALARARATRLTKLVHFPRKIKNLLLGASGWGVPQLQRKSAATRGVGVRVRRGQPAGRGTFYR
jgi:hypothetical protein